MRLFGRQRGLDGGDQVGRFRGNFRVEALEDFAVTTDEELVEVPGDLSGEG